ncbi:MAG: hypothetical protein A2787_00335 [Omnitrophica WOR_2 bacterium RIFCSPHIGHO2_01_FULL_48_9]|nr:MAG: hypothetical protein A3D10_06545 [Omnitrophica WOR_2 bacterium RIFCSPHIGHO2_02_FULL_48_11]OGX33096.1 MAG: hypothetical protein A2787_00335 [Omnitrophica WOR_2 bacterium RIFCSPHIGHO2_01_FULL_48_9]
MKKKFKLIIGGMFVFALLFTMSFAWAEEDPALPDKPPGYTSPIFDDQSLLDGYSKSYAAESQETILAMIQDDTLDDYKIAAAVRVFKENFSEQLVLAERRYAEKVLIHRLNRTDSPFVEVEVMHALCKIDRYKYFGSMVPVLLQKLDHYNRTVNELANESITDIIKGPHRPREARIVFNTLRKTLFLIRRRLYNIKEPDTRLKQKLVLLRWAIKILGNEELKRLPKEVIPLL